MVALNPCRNNAFNRYPSGWFQKSNLSFVALHLTHRWKLFDYLEPKVRNDSNNFQRPTVLYAEKTDKKCIIFFDELPWLATHRSGFLRAFGFFWNNWASKSDALVVISGSAASWIIEKVIRDKGGLHNRITRRITLHPFNLAETKTYFDSKNIRLNHYETILIYMAMGGIPHYLMDKHVAC